MVDTIKVTKLLNSVYLGGLINECLLNVDDNTLSILAADITDSLIVAVNCEVDFPIEYDTFGIGDLGILTKYFAMVGDGDINIKRSDNKLNIQWKKHGTFKYLLSDPSTIATSMEDPDILEEYYKFPTHTIVVKENHIKQIQSYISLTSTPSVYFTIKPKDKNRLRASSGTVGEHNFSMNFGKTKTKSKKSVAVKIPSKLLMPVLNALTFDEDDGDVVFGLCVDKPLVIRQDDSLWGILPLMEE